MFCKANLPELLRTPKNAFYTLLQEITVIKLIIDRTLSHDCCLCDGGDLFFFFANMSMNLKISFVFETITKKMETVIPKKRPGLITLSL